MSSASEKSSRGNAGQFRVASELCRRGMQASITLGNTPGVDVLCMSADGRKCVTIQVKTFRAGQNKCTVGEKAEVDRGGSFFWVLVGLKDDEHPNATERFYILPSKDMARNVKDRHDRWLATPGRNGQKHNESRIRNVWMNNKGPAGRFDISEYEDRWDYIEKALA